jgi:hypothetical protein
VSARTRPSFITVAASSSTPFCCSQRSDQKRSICAWNALYAAYDASKSAIAASSSVSLRLNGATSPAVRPWRAQATICHWLTRST